MKIREEVLGDFGFVVEYSWDDKLDKVFSVSFKVVEIVARLADSNSIEYELEGAQDSMDTTGDFDKAQRFISGFVKWDGCSHFYFGDNQGYIHLCGRREIQKISDLIKIIYNNCGMLITSYKLENEFPV